MDGAGRERLVRDGVGHYGRFREIYDIFEGTEQIQQLVISRGISGLRIE
jgi:alkylation response protein AidB-like acyl-CoA dehydrogenase